MGVAELAQQVDLMVLQEEEMEEGVEVELALPVETMVLHPQVEVEDLVEDVEVALALQVDPMVLQVVVLVEDLELETATVLLVTTWLDTTAEDEEEDVEDVNPG